MLLNQKTDNKLIEFVKGLFSIFGVGLTICLILFSLFSFSFFALIIPSVKIAFSIIFNTNSLIIEKYLIFSIEGSFIGLVFSIISKIKSYLKYNKYKIEYFSIIEKQTILFFIFLSSIIGFIIVFINRASGLSSIYEVIKFKNIYINEKSPIGEVLDYWGLYSDRNNSQWTHITLLFIIIFLMDITVSIFCGIINGIIFGIIEIRDKEKKIKIIDISEHIEIEKKEIIFFSIIENIIQTVLLGGVIGLVYGILGCKILYSMVQNM